MNGFEEEREEEEEVDKEEVDKEEEEMEEEKREEEERDKQKWEKEEKREERDKDEMSFFYLSIQNIVRFQALNRPCCQYKTLWHRLVNKSFHVGTHFSSISSCLDSPHFLESITTVISFAIY